MPEPRSLTRREFIRRPLAAGALLAATTATGAMSNGWRAGVGKTILTPSGPVWMAGYGARNRECDTTASDLWAKALALEDATGARSVLIALDSCGIGREVAASITREIERRFQLPPASVLINMSHSHCSPFTEGLVWAMQEFTSGQWSRIVAYTRWLEHQAVAAVGAALAAMEPVTVAHGRSEAGFAVNRRNNTEADVPRLRAENKLAGPVDHDVPVLAVRRLDGTTKAIVCSYACHTTTLNGYEWNGDYAGFAQEEIESRHAGATAFFTQGCGGDINPVPRRTVELARSYGRDLADAVDRVLATKMIPLRGALRTDLKRVDLAFGPGPTRKELEAAAAEDESPKNRYERLRARHLLRELSRGRSIPRSYPYPVRTWRFDGLTWVALGGEPVVEYSIALKKALGSSTWVLGYSSEIMAYIPSERVLREGGYEGATSMAVFGLPAPWTPGLEQKILATARHLATA